MAEGEWADDCLLQMRAAKINRSWVVITFDPDPLPSSLELGQPEPHIIG